MKYIKYLLFLFSNKITNNNDWKNLKNKHFTRTRRKSTFKILKSRSTDTKRAMEIISHEAGGRLVKRLKRDGGSASIYLALGREDGEFIGLSIANLSASVCYRVFELSQTEQTRSVYIFPERPTHTHNTQSRLRRLGHTASIVRASSFAHSLSLSLSRHIGFTFAICICLRPDLLCY